MAAVGSSSASGDAARGWEEREGAGADNIDKDETVAGGAGVGAREMGGEEEGEPAEGEGRAMAVRGAQGEGVVGAAVGAGGPEEGAQHGSSLWTGARASDGGAGDRRDGEGVGCWEDYSRRRGASSGCDACGGRVTAVRRGQRVVWGRWRVKAGRGQRGRCKGTQRSSEVAGTTT